MSRKQPPEAESRAGSTAFLISRIIVRFAFYILVVLLAIFLVRQAYAFGYSVFHSNPMTGKPGKDIAVTVTEDMSKREIGKMLENKNLIRDGNVFAVQATIYRYTIYPGTYVLNTSETITEMVEKMSVPPETESDMY